MAGEYRSMRTVRRPLPGKPGRMVFMGFSDRLQSMLDVPWFGGGRSWRYGLAQARASTSEIHACPRVIRTTRVWECTRREQPVRR